MSRLSLRAEIYRGFQRSLVKPIVVSRILKRAGERERIFSELAAVSKPATERGWPVGWFHAASTGELEMLVPVIEKWASLSTPGGERVGVVITVFSESAEGQLRKLDSSLRASGARALFSGFAPWEGDWKDVLALGNPDFLLTARYEAWPELWMSLGNQGIPLMVVGARSRSSLRWAKRACRWMGEPLPNIVFCSIGDGELAELRQQFPESQFATTGDPRWERVLKRAETGSPRARELIERYRELPRPWGVLGSAWEEDLKRWLPALRAKACRGTLWVVPHRVQDSFVIPIEKLLDSCGMAHMRVGNGAGNPNCLVVNEMGFLSELYSSADWAYVGGGFSEGVHNTIEPAIHGIPVACGPRGADRFPEIQMLESSGQLHRTGNAQEIARWVERAVCPADEALRARWRETARSQLGASNAVMRELSRWVSGWQLRQ